MSHEQEPPERQIRAAYTDGTVTVYQAFSNAIADAALNGGRFVEPFRRSRMTWIKPSFLWMAYRSGWATKPGQERGLAIEISRAGFEWALGHSSLSHFEPGTYADTEVWTTRKNESPVRIQWDPERNVHLDRLPYRSIQIGLGGPAVDHYVDDWIVSITDITEILHHTHRLVSDGLGARAEAQLPREDPYPLPQHLATTIGATSVSTT